MSEEQAAYLSEQSKRIHYIFYKNILESKGYSFKYFDRPYDVWGDGKNQIRICEGCRILYINNIRHFLSEKILIGFLFNTK